MFHVCAVTNILHLSDKPTNAHISMFSHILLFFTTCSVTAVTIISVAYNNNTVNIQIIVQKCTIKPSAFTLDIVQ